MLAARSASPTAASIAATRAAAARSSCPASRSGSATFCATVRYGSTWNAWNTKPTCVRRNAVSASSSSARRSAPATTTVPASGASRPAITLSSVDLPEPDSPRIATSSPRTTSSVTRSSTVRGRGPGNDLVTPERRITVRRTRSR